MLNPITYTEHVISDFLRYQITAYPFADSHFYAQMRTLLNLEETRATPLLKGPYISLSRTFQKGATVADLVDDGVLHPGVARVAEHPHVYGHQEQAIRAIVGDRHTLVSTGTGSGKTESFLYPIISHCFKLRDANAPPGITAVIVYPMNALAEDQLSRLRELLAGTGITFGMYIGKTPYRTADAPGEYLPPGSSKADYLAARQRAQEEKREYAVYPPEERVSRERMRTPGEQPRILLTNVKQLELLLTRQIDVELFENAQLQFLVFDEAHTFSGAAGAETACLVRRLRAFCGRSADETVCVATSATIVDPERGPEAGRDFAVRFFGVNPNNVELVGEKYEPDLWAEKRRVPGPLPGNPAVHLKNVLEAVEQADAGRVVKAVFQAMTGEPIDASNWQASLYEHLAANELVYQMVQTLAQPRTLSDLVQDLSERVGRLAPEEEVLAWLALGAASRKEERPFIRPVVHAFIRGVGGAVATFPKGEERPRLWLSALDAAQEEEDDFRLPIMTCTTCGQHYFIHHLADFSFTDLAPDGGQQVESRRVWLPLAETLGGNRLVLLDQLVTQDEQEEENGEEAAVPRSVKMCLCRTCGALHPDYVERCDACSRPDNLVRLHVVRQKEDARGYLTSCVACGTAGRRGVGGFREPARPVRAITVSDVHVLAQNMIQHAERRRLLVFADNRQDAAFQAGWMQDHARRFRLRSLMYEQIAQGPVSVGDLTAYLDDLLDSDDDLSRALVPEVWRIHRKEAEGVRHRDERKKFLRIQVLREITTGVKQRIGLEPWGRIKVRYSNLTAGLPFVRRWAEQLQIEPTLLVDGIASLLDVARRNAILLDREGRIFSQFWNEGDFEVQRGYLPLMPGVPKGLKLVREPNDKPARVQQWLSEKGNTLARQVARRWGVPTVAIDQFFDELWELLTAELELLVPVTLTGWKRRALTGATGVRQIDADKLLIAPHRGVYRCNVCRRAHVRPTPNMVCMAWRCQGTIRFEDENPDDYDLMVLDAQFTMIRAREHSAQVPGMEREVLERMFKGESELVNTLVCTPTLELGVDIGALDAVLMRNVPPLPANYWQRAGRAGRRHRMAVNLTYARPASHDRAYFQNPLRLLLGVIYPPRINLRNELMVQKHVHAAVLTALNQLERNRSLNPHDRNEITEALRHCFPTHVKAYLFNQDGHVRAEPLNAGVLNTVISKHAATIMAHVRAVFAQNWPEADAAVVSEENLGTYVHGMSDRLNEVIRRIWKRLNWALDQMDRLNDVRRRKGTLDPAEDALRARCDRLVKRLKGVQSRRRQEREGYDDTYTYGVLAAEGFLPGYGLDTGSVLATAQMPRLSAGGLTDFDLPRSPAVALREYAPGNLIYANGNRFIPRFYHLEPDAPVEFQVDMVNEAIAEVGQVQNGMDMSMAASSMMAISICDVDMPHQSHITDEEDYRFQLAVSVIGYEQDRHGEGRGYQWNGKDVTLRHNVHMRLVNVGPAGLVQTGRLGYPVCLVCGQSRSPFTSEVDRDQFSAAHLERCGQPVAEVGFYADVVADALAIQDCENRQQAYSVAEALRMGAAHVLDMEVDDLQLLTIGQAGTETVDVLLYDPMPGGSGLLEQIVSRWAEVVDAALEVVNGCHSECDTACIDCLLIFRNAHYHRYLNRHEAAEQLSAWGKELRFSHDIPARLPDMADTSGEMPVNEAESRLRDMLLRAGFPTPTAQYPIDLGRPLSVTTPDFFYEDANDYFEGICIYLDGMSQHIHGNPETQRRDRMIREELRNREYQVFEIPYGDLHDRQAMAEHFYRLGRVLLGRTQAQEMRDDLSWYDTHKK